MRAHVEDDAVGLDRAGDVHRVDERGDRLLVDRVVRSRQVHEIDRMADHAFDRGLGAALLEPLEVRRVVVRRPPGPRALREDLNRVGAHRLGAVDGGMDPARHRHVSSRDHPGIP
jgi:hypothetical protein